MVPRDQFLQHFDVGILFLQAFNTEMLLFVEKSGFCQFLFNTSYVTKLPPHPLQEGFVPVFVRLNSSQGPVRGAIISSPPSTHLKEKKRFFKTSYYLLS